MATAQSFNPVELKLFKALRRQPTDLARYAYLEKVMPGLSGRSRSTALQLLSSAESELGLYNQAILSFPLKVSTPAGIALPQPGQWRAADAADTIAKLAASRRIVMINEAHHNAHTRVLTLALLPRLRALGFNYFAVEALVGTDPGLQRRGYPTLASGSEYLHDPIYGEIVREAIRLGFTIVPYDTSRHLSTQKREIEQADTLYKKVFAKDPGARLFVHAGYAHIDKDRGRLGNIEPMAMRLKSLTGFDPLSIDQTQFLEALGSHEDDYHQLVSRFHPQGPTVLVDRADGKAWSARPALYDVNVILPPSANLKSFGNASMVNGESVRSTADTAHLALSSLITLDPMFRPGWLTLDGARHALPVSTTLCRSHVPCVVEAQYDGESGEAIAADRYAFIKNDARTWLYLFPGHYRLRALDAEGKVLSERPVTIDKPRGGTPPPG